MKTQKTMQAKVQVVAKGKLPYVSPKATFVPVTSAQRLRSCQDKSGKLVFSRDPHKC